MSHCLQNDPFNHVIVLLSSHRGDGTFYVNVFMFTYFQELIELADIGRAVFYYRRSVKYTEEYVR